MLSAEYEKVCVPHLKSEIQSLQKKKIQERGKNFLLLILKEKMLNVKIKTATTNLMSFSRMLSHMDSAFHVKDMNISTVLEHPKS